MLFAEWWAANIGSDIEIEVADMEGEIVEGIENVEVVSCYNHPARDFAVITLEDDRVIVDTTQGCRLVYS